MARIRYVFTAAVLLAMASPVGLLACKTRTLGALQSARDSNPSLSFSITDSPNENYFLRDDSRAVHLIATSGLMPRIIFAYPAANSNAALVFDKVARPVQLTVEKDASSSLGIRPTGRAPSTVTSGFRTDTRELVLNLRRVVLGSVRVTRDLVEGPEAKERLEAHTAAVPTEILSSTNVSTNADGTIELKRRQLNGRDEIVSLIKPHPGTTLYWNAKTSVLRFVSNEPSRVGFDIDVTNTSPMLRPLAANEIFSDQKGSASSRSDDALDRQALEFLSSREKLLAGSWRFMTYFGRDTLLSARLLRPAVSPAFMRAALGSVIERLGGPGMLPLDQQTAHPGMVAHEEDIGDFANLHHLRHKKLSSLKDVPRYDYGMVDSDFLLPPVLEDFLTTSGRDQAETFLRTRVQRAGVDTTYGELLKTHFERVVNLAEPFAKNPQPENLIHLLNDKIVGDWRDSADGLGGGVTSFNVNASLVPAALSSIERVLRTPPLSELESADQLAKQAGEYANIWNKEAAQFFEVRVPSNGARQAQQDYCRKLSLNCPADSLSSSDADAVVFDAVSLDSRRRPIPVLHSDYGFELLFNEPSEVRLRQIAALVAAPFPAGLITDAGMVVANPVYADAKMQSRFNHGSYHGIVVWSWQQALMAAGLARQLEMTRQVPLLPETLAALRSAQSTLWKVIQQHWDLRRSELWGWKAENGRAVPVSFSELTKDNTEPNALQLWSTVYLAVKPPEAGSK